ncbi:TPA: hypothetical protein ACGOYG_002060, partial [Streptococcus suis]
MLTCSPVLGKKALPLFDLGVTLLADECDVPFTPVEPDEPIVSPVLTSDELLDELDVLVVFEVLVEVSVLLDSAVLVEVSVLLDSAVLVEVSVLLDSSVLVEVSVLL